MDAWTARRIVLWLAMGAAVAALLPRERARAEADWVELAAPGRAEEGPVDPDKEGKGAAARAVLDLLAFDGRVYIELSPEVRRPVKGEKPAPARTAIVAFDPAGNDLVREYVAASAGFGTFRILDGRLHVPDRFPADDAGGGGFYVSAGAGKWERVTVTEKPASFCDITLFDDRYFLGGSLAGQGIVAWRHRSEKAWNVIHLTAEAARWSTRGTRFLAVPGHLALLADRQPDPNPMALVAPQAWGAWYLLHYIPKGSERGFLFDGPPRPLPALRTLAPGSRLPASGYSLGHDIPLGEELLFTVLASGETVRDEQGGLFRAKADDGPPQVGRTLRGRRVPEMDLACDAAMDGPRCYVLLAKNAAAHGRIVVSQDLERWTPVFDGDLPASPVSLAVLNGQSYIGLDNGSLLMILKP